METLDEAKDFIRFLYAQVQEKNSREEMLMQEVASLKELVSQKERDTDTISRLLADIERLMHELSEARVEISRLVSVNSSLVEQNSVLKKHRYGSPSQRNRRSKGAEDKNASDNTSQNRDEEKDGFDGTNERKQMEEGTETAEQEEKHNSGTDQARKGSKYSKMEADEKILHKSDVTLLPKGATYLWTETRKSFEQITKVVEHDYEVFYYLDEQGRLQCGYFPDKNDPNYASYIDRFPGTHASADFLANLVYDKYVMATPYHREMEKVAAQYMSTCRQTLMNWVRKPYSYLLKVVEQFKNAALKDGHYTIDNLAAERAIRPLTVERNNSMFFCSHKGAETSALYHTIIATCKKQGYKVLDYLKEFFKQIILGRCDNENLMPATIGIKANNKR